MDLQLLSASSSPAMNVLLQDSEISPLLYSLKSSYPLMSRQKVSVRCGSNWDFGKTNTFQLNRYGILAGLVLKMTFNVGASTDIGLNLGNALIKRAALTSHSREICQTLDIANLAEVLEMPYGTKERLMDLAKNDEPGVVAAGTTSFTAYVPLHLSFVKNGLSMALDLQFVEQLECQVELAPKTDVFVNSTGASLDVAGTELLCYYYNMSESDLRRYEDANFSVEKPLSIMAESVYAENVVRTGAVGVANTQTYATVNFNCPNVVTKTVIALKQTSPSGTPANGIAGQFAPIDKIEYYLSGRLVFSSTGDENHLENALFYGSSYGLGTVVVGGGNDSNQNLYTHYWAVSNEKNRFSGGLSGKNVSDWTARVYFTPDNVNDEYEVHTQHCYVNIVSISGASGKVGVSLSL
jgi:hypothetical protein